MAKDAKRVKMHLLLVGDDFMKMRTVWILGAVMSAYVSCAYADDSTLNLTLDQRVARLENQVHYIAGNLNGNSSSVQSNLESLQGQLDDIQHQLSQLQALQSTVSALTQKVDQLAVQQKTQAVAVQQAVAPLTKEAIDAKADALYQTAYNDAMKKHYVVAIRHFNEYIRQYPKGKNIGDAYYWLGQLYLTQGSPDKATNQFRNAINYASSAKAPDAMLQLGVIYQTNGDSAHAKQMFQKLIKAYPKTAAAKSAQQHLQSLTPQPTGQ